MRVGESVPCREFIVQIIQFKGPSYTKEMAPGLSREGHNTLRYGRILPQRRST